MGQKKLVLVVEDSLPAIHAIRESLEAMEVPHRFMAQVDQVDRVRITGLAPGEGESPYSLAWSQVSVLFSDYHLGGTITGADVVENACYGGVGLIVGMSSDSGFNRRLLAAGAQIAEPKAQVIRGIGAGRWQLI